MSEDGSRILLDVMAGRTTDEAIRDQEARGQRRLVSNETLPHNFNYGSVEEIETMGVIYGEPVDDLFSEVELPEGWSKIPTNHSMWSVLEDEKGRKRANIFYKAAFYDRDAFISLSRRFSYGSEPVDGWNNDYDSNNDPIWGIVRDGDNIIWHSSSIRPQEYGGSVEFYEAKNGLSDEAKEWLMENYPEYKSLLAYWDE